MLTFLPVLAVYAMLSTSSAGAAASSEARPGQRNAVLITMDTVRADVLGYMGGPARTPALDRMATRGWNFKACMAASMLTNPSHASIFTSLYPRDHGVYDNDAGIAENTPTLATTLQAAGWHTGAVVNFMNLNPTVAHLGQVFARVIEATSAERSADLVTQEALKLIDHLPQPFFVWIHYSDPHAPYEPDTDGTASAGPWPHLASLGRVRNLMPAFQRHNAWFAQVLGRKGDTQPVVDAYIAEVERVDRALGQLQDGLASRHLGEKTVLLATADHGENLGEHNMFFHHGGLYNSTIHVPWVMQVPQAASMQRTELVSAIDIAPTLLDVLGVPAAKNMRGISAVRVDHASRLAFSEHMLGQLASVRSDKGTLILHRQNSRMFPAYPFSRGKREVLPRDLPEEEVERLDNALKTFLMPPVMASRSQALPMPERRATLRQPGYSD